MKGVSNHALFVGGLLEARCEISSTALRDNLDYFHRRVTPGDIIPVVKANAYGHGVIEIINYLQEYAYIPFFGVATLEEAREIAVSYPERQVLIFSRVFPHELSSLPEKAILTITSLEDAKQISASSSREMNVHLNVNTGMNRLGLMPDEAMEMIRNPLPHLKIQGIYSHYSSADTLKDSVFQKQSRVFKEFTETIRAMGYSGMVHLANSAAALKQNDELYDAIRLGIGLYGYDPSEGGEHRNDLKPVMTLKAPLIRLERLKAGATVSYGERWSTSTSTNLGTLRIGYADGYSRKLTNRAYVCDPDGVYPVIGSVTMDHIMIDFGSKEAKIGEYLTVMGGVEQPCSAYELSKILNTIPYEICCAVSPRVKRVYL